METPDRNPAFRRNSKLEKRAGQDFISTETNVNSSVSILLVSANLVLHCFLISSLDQPETLEYLLSHEILGIRLKPEFSAADEARLSKRRQLRLRKLPT
jgi:hypothetical protein